MLDTKTVDGFSASAVMTKPESFDQPSESPTSLAALIPTDRLFPLQWHLATDMAWNLNVTDVWDTHTGAGIAVAVFDQGIDPSHVDLNNNFDFANAISTVGVGNGRPRTAADNHGTAVAGIIGAELGDGAVVGVAFESDLIAIYSPLDENGFAAQTAIAFNHAAAFADVINNSWGYGNLFLSSPGAAFVDNFKDPQFADAKTALENMAQNGRDGLGTIVIQAAGNAKEYGDDTNLHNFQNSIYAITVAAILQNGDAADFSTPGASVHVAAPGNNVTTTDRAGTDGYTAGNYVSSFSGTSAAAPMVAGVVALMLEANPMLGARDVQQILAYSAVNSDPDQSSTTWQINGADDWNGGGLHFSHDLGFGLVDAHAAVQLAKSWDALGIQHTFTNAVSNNPSARTPQTAIPENSFAGTTDSFYWGFDRIIDRVEIDVSIVHTYVGDLVVELTSPSGTKATLLNRPGKGVLSGFGSPQENVDFTFMSTAFLGEHSTGSWTMTVKDRAGQDLGLFNRWRMHFVYDAEDGNDNYIYTDEFSAYATAGRTLLDDADGGIDTINAAAVTSNATIDLTPGSSNSRIDGEKLFLADGVIENAHGGVGNDTLRGNQCANRLWGGDGDDTLVGGGGADTIDAANGNDIVLGGSGRDKLSGGPGIDEIFGGSGADTIKGNGGTDYLLGEEGDDLIRGGNGNDRLLGRAGNDTLRGGTGADRLTGGRNDDNIRGQSGDDVLWGDTGADHLNGGAGADRFMFTSGFGSDVIADFDSGEGDTIWLESIGLGVFSFSDLAITTTAGGSGLINFSDDDSILVKGVLTLDSSDVIFF